MRRDKIINPNDVGIVFGILIVLLIIGSLFDFQITTSVAALNNTVSTVVATYAMLPLTAMVSFLGLQIIAGRDCRDRTKDIGALVAGLLLMGASIALSVYNTTLYFHEMELYVNVLIAAALNIGLSMLLHNVTLNSEADELYRFKKFAMTVMIVASLLTLIGRLLWDRMDYIYLVENNPSLFQSWWVITSNIKITTSESFPSYYVMSFSSLMSLSLFSRLIYAFRHDERFLFYVGFIVALVLSAILIVGGYIYISDLAISMMVMCLVQVISIKVIYNE